MTMLWVVLAGFAPIWYFAWRTGDVRETLFYIFLWWPFVLFSLIGALYSAAAYHRTTDTPSRRAAHVTIAAFICISVTFLMHILIKDAIRF